MDDDLQYTGPPSDLDLETGEGGADSEEEGSKHSGPPGSRKTKVSNWARRKVHTSPDAFKITYTSDEEALAQAAGWNEGHSIEEESQAAWAQCSSCATVASAWMEARIHYSSTGVVRVDLAQELLEHWKKELLAYTTRRRS